MRACRSKRSNGRAWRWRETASHLTDEPLLLAFTARNAAVVEFTARRFDLPRFAEASSAKLPDIYEDCDPTFFEDRPWKKYLEQEVITWTQELLPGEDGRAVKGTTHAPLKGPGAYFVEARVAGNKKPSRTFAVLTDTLLLRKAVKDGDSAANIFIACDARKGRPLPGRAVRVSEWVEDPGGTPGFPKFRENRQTLITDANGAVFYRRLHRGEISDVLAVMFGSDGAHGVLQPGRIDRRCRRDRRRSAGATR